MSVTPEWVLPGPAQERIAERLMNERPMPAYFARILANRGITSYAEAEAFANPSLDNLRDPFLFKDMHIAIDRLKKALRNSEHVMILGDYDVDGVCGTSLFVRVISNLGMKVSYYIPNRFKEGYGVSTEGVDEAESLGATLIMTVDTGRLRRGHLRQEQGHRLHHHRPSRTPVGDSRRHGHPQS